MVAERSEATHASLVDRDIRYFVVVGRWSGADPSLSGDGFVGRRSVECAEARRPCSASAKTDYGIPAQAARDISAQTSDGAGPSVTENKVRTGCDKQ